MKILTVASVVMFLAALELYRVSLPSGIPGAVASSLAIMALALYLAYEGWNTTREVAPVTAAAEPKVAAVAPPTSPPPQDVRPDIVNFLSLLQRNGRFIDFLMDDITQYDDKQVGAAGRIVHQGCSEVLREYFHIEPVRTDAEGVAVTLERNYDADQNRLVGKVVGNPPFRGVVVHRGWKTTKVNLPRVVTADAVASREIIQPAEIELT